MGVREGGGGLVVSGWGCSKGVWKGCEGGGGGGGGLVREFGLAEQLAPTSMIICCSVLITTSYQSTTDARTLQSASSIVTCTGGVATAVCTNHSHHIPRMV